MLADFAHTLTPALVACGAGLVIFPFLSPTRPAARIFALGVAATLLVIYMAWRVTASLPAAGLTADFVIGGVFLALEVASLLAALLLLFFLTRTSNRTPEVERNRAWLASLPAPLVDVFICTYNEERSIVERTMIGARAMDYANFRVWVLDDGRRAWLRDLSAELGCHYLTRADNAHAKAGNINHALAHVAALPQPPAFISILDADFVPRSQFLTRALCLFRAPDTAIVQTPQHFINPDPIQINLSAAHAWPDDQRFFFDVILPSKDAWGAAFCCGTSSVIRLEHLAKIGGFPTDSVTEDYLLTLRLKEHGFKTVYLNEPLTLGLAPEGVKEYLTQRGRWCLGLMQIARGRSGPLSKSSRLTFIDRLSLIDAFLGWTAVYYAKAFGLIIPALYLLLGVRCVAADLGELLAYFLPYFVWQTMTMAWISRGRAMAVMSDVTQLIALPTILRAAVVGLVRPAGQKFHVTAKGGDRSQSFIEWSLFKIYAALLLINVAGLVVTTQSFWGSGPAPEDSLAFAWSWFNTLILTIVCFVCIEKPRHRKAERFRATGVLPLEFDGLRQAFQLADISITGARLIGCPPAPVGAQGGCQLDGGLVSCSIGRAVDGGFTISFDESLPTRIQAVRNFYEHDYVKPFGDIGAAGVTRALVRRLVE
jgi:cellulose synthase (UDP-forming)